MLPIHPAIVHFPIALLPLAAVLRWWLLWRPSPWGDPAARLCSWLGTLFLAAAVISGQAAIPTHMPEEATPVFQLHQQLGTLLLLWYGSIALWEVARHHKMRRVELLALTLAHSIGSAIVLFTGSLGGRLVYEYGVGVTAGQD
ncbi:MAG: DUF2231 domain-containing protein [Candidatus Kapabacteria bacterium]|nr:DUF2231 domain-containing protein [Candidatus Kapabacteria bacterium]MDW8012446.1 DUF2231 domain-containing protein [Bacteroidota bacterium]